MFNFSFYELMVLGIIALVILGPEKLPQAVRTLGTYYSKFRRTVSTLKAEMEAELDLAETRQLMEQELAKIRESEAAMQKQMAQLQGSIKEFEQQQNTQLQKSQLGQSASEKARSKKNEDDWVHPVSQANPVSQGNLSSSSSDDSSSEDSSSYAGSGKQSESLQIENSETSTESEQDPTTSPMMTRPWKNMWFLLGDYDRVRRWPPAPFLPNYTANPLLYDTTTSSAKPTEVKP